MMVPLFSLRFYDMHSFFGGERWEWEGLGARGRGRGEGSLGGCQEFHCSIAGFSHALRRPAAVRMVLDPSGIAPTYWG